MKGVLFFVLIIACIAMCAYSSSSSCHSAEQCGEGYCCTRATGYSRGYCKKLAAEGERCHPTQHIESMYKMSICPCGEGLTCSLSSTDMAIFIRGPVCKR